MPDTPTMRTVGSVMAIGRASTASRFEGSDRKVERLDLGRSDGEGRFVGKGGEERLHDLGIELDAFPVLELLERVGHQQRGAVGPQAGHRVERVGHGDDAHFDRDLLALQAVGKALAVEPLMVGAHDGERRGSVAHQGGQHARADHRVLHDMAVFRLGELPRLVGHRFPHADLADVVQLGAERDHVEGRGRETHPAGDGQGVVRDAHRGSPRIGVLLFGEVDEGLEPLERQLLDPARLLLDAVLELLVVHAVLEDEAALVERLHDPGAHLVEVERLGHVVERPELQARDRALHLRDGGHDEHRGVRPLRELLAKWPDTAVLVVTAVAEVESAVSCLQLGALDYVAKPFHLDEVRARVMQALDKRRLILENRMYHQQLEDRVQEQARRIEELSLERLQALVHFLEEKDTYPRGPAVRVANYALAIARGMSLPPAALDMIALGAELHDIGKIGVRESVPHKPGKLSEAEYRHIMEHPVIGARVLAPLMRDAPAALAIVRSHHERLDGKGFPDGLKGSEIAIEVRVVTVADSFDAMTSVRPYRPALSVSKALQELEEGNSIQFDTEVVQGFLTAFPDAAALPVATPEVQPLHLPVAPLEARRG